MPKHALGEGGGRGILPTVYGEKKDSQVTEEKENLPSAKSLNFRV